MGVIYIARNPQAHDRPVLEKESALESVLLQMSAGEVNPAEELAAWNQVVGWLGRLRKLEGVPFRYVVPSEHMLPNNSIRFFHLDRNWLDAIVDGALSTGVMDSRGSLSEGEKANRLERYHKLMARLAEEDKTAKDYRYVLSVSESVNALPKSEKDEFDSRLQNFNSSLSESSATPAKWDLVVDYLPDYVTTVGGSRTGFLLRSSVVRDFPGLSVNAYYQLDPSKDAYSVQNKILTLRQVRLSETVLMCIFDGVPTHLRIEEPREGIRLGMEQSQSADYNYEYQFTPKDKQGRPVMSAPRINVGVRKGTGDSSVLRINDFDQAKQYFTSHGIIPQHGAFLATQLMEYPYQQDFEYDTLESKPFNAYDPSETNDVGSVLRNVKVRVNEESIVADADDIDALEASYESTGGDV